MKNRSIPPTGCGSPRETGGGWSAFLMGRIRNWQDFACSRQWKSFSKPLFFLMDDHCDESMTWEISSMRRSSTMPLSRTSALYVRDHCFLLCGTLSLDGRNGHDRGGGAQCSGTSKPTMSRLPADVYGGGFAVLNPPYIYYIYWY